MSTLTPISYFIKIISFILLNGKAKEIVHSFKKFFFTSTMSHKFVYSHWITKADKRVFTIFWGSTWWTKLLILIRPKKILQGIAYLNIILDLFSRNLMCEINLIALQKIFCKRIWIEGWPDHSGISHDKSQFLFSEETLYCRCERNPKLLLFLYLKWLQAIHE